VVVVRLHVEAGSDRVQTWPAGREDLSGSDDLVISMADAGGNLGSIEVGLRSGRGVRPFERRLLDDIADQAAVALRNVRLQVELACRVEQLHHRADELANSRARLIGAADTERRRLESALGREVLPVMGGLRAALTDCATPTPDEETIATFVGRATEALEDLRELTRGIYPTMLARTGLGPAVASYAARQGLADALTVAPSVASARYPEAVGAAAYFCSAEALSHGTAGLTVTLTQVSESLVVSVSGLDTEGFDRWAVCDRVEACGGLVEVTRHPGSASLRVALPGATVGASPGPTPAGARSGLNAAFDT
jgi:hypothetical protein